MNVLPLGSYDVLIGMDWLEARRVKLECTIRISNVWKKKGT